MPGRARREVHRNAGLLCCGYHIGASLAARKAYDAVWLKGEHVPIADRPGALAVLLPFGPAAREHLAHIDRPFARPPISTGRAFTLDNLGDAAKGVDVVQRDEDVRPIGIVATAADDDSDGHFLSIRQIAKKAAEKLLNSALTSLNLQPHSTTFSARGPVFRGLFGGAGGI